MDKENVQNKSIDIRKLPQHIAIIMDGNRRWAEEKKLPRSAGHREGVKAVKRVISSCIELNIPILTLYAFSTENWKRPKKEVSNLLYLFSRALNKEKGNLFKNNIKINFLGRTNELPDSIFKQMNEIAELTKDNTKLILNIAVNYGGRTEIVDAINSIIKMVQEEKIKIEDVNENTVKDNLYAHMLPDPDLLIRTAGEMRISNFMVWQIAYTEFWVTPVYWPDFNKVDLVQAINDFQKRVRKYGGNI